MRGGGWMILGVVGGWVVVSAGGCVSLDKHRRVEASLRTVQAEKEALAQELFDVRNGTGSLRSRVESLEREVAAKDDLIANLRNENELLDQMRKTAVRELEGLGNKMGDVTVLGPKLPPPLDNALKRFADEHPSEVSYDSAHGTVKWKSDLLFALGSDVVKQSSMEALKGFTDILNAPIASDFEVLVVGHTDNRPIARASTKKKHPTNWHLSVHRAIAVAQVLRKDGYSPERIGLMGYGPFRPVADNATEEGASQNRRVEIYLVPRGSIVQTTLGDASRGARKPRLSPPGASPGK